MAICRTQESKKKARRSINCMFLGRMMICGIEKLKEILRFGLNDSEMNYTGKNS